ncbi:hypothetical protein C8R43DRAFT_859485, partial [Mycena crocata]
LSSEQRLAHDVVVHHLDLTLGRGNPRQLLTIVRGDAGSGKTELFRTLVDTFAVYDASHILGKTACSDSAAALVDGSTLHTFLSLVDKNGVPTSATNRITAKRYDDLKGIRYLFVDNASRLSNEQLMRVSASMAL